MTISVETLQGLERKVTVTVPSSRLEEEVGQRLRRLTHKVRIHGFRPGKVPLSVVKQHYSASVRDEVARELVQSTLFDALKTHDLVPAGTPQIEPEQLEQDQDFIYSAKFEVFPQFAIQELDQAAVDSVQSTVLDTDVDELIEKLREQHRQWSEVDRPVAMGDKIIFDFKGLLDGVPFEGGEAHDYELIVGSGKMVDGFESGLINAQKNISFDIDVTFPKDYGHERLAGQKATFNIMIKQIMAGSLPELDDTFAALFNIKSGGMDALKVDIKANMERELERRVSTLNREKAFDALLAVNPIDLPIALVDQEIEHLKHEFYHQVFGHEHTENEKIPDFPRQLFEDRAKRRVHLSLLFSEYVKTHAMTVDEARVQAMIEKLAGAYENPDELKSWYQGNDQRLAEIESLVMEEMVADKILEKAHVIQKTLSYNEVVNPAPTNDDNSDKTQDDKIQDNIKGEKA